MGVGTSEVRDLLRPVAVIAGGMERPGSGEVVEHTDPSTASVVTTFRLAVEADIEEALAATRHAQPAWARTSIEGQRSGRCRQEDS